MTTPDQNDSSAPEPQTVLNSLIDAFKSLPSLLSYGGLILIVAFVFLYFGGVLPDILLAVPVIAIVAFLLYAFMERHHELPSNSSIKRDYGLEKQEQMLDHNDRSIAQTPFVQSRRLEAAMPKLVHAGDTTELLVMIPRLGDLGLRAFLPIETEAGDLITKEDVSSRDAEFEFTTPKEPISVYIKIETSSLDFKVERPSRAIKIYPDREGDYETFYLTALRVVRRARVAVRFFVDQELTDSLGTLRLDVPIVPDTTGVGSQLSQALREERMFKLVTYTLTYIAGDNIGGDKINAVIANSSGVAIGRDANANFVCTNLAQYRTFQEYFAAMDFLNALVQRGVLPAKDRALAGQVLDVPGDDRPGVGVVVHEGLLLPDIAWGGGVSAGAYEIGGDEGAFESLDKQTVTIPHAFRLASCPVTNSQFQCFVQAPDIENEAWWQGMPDNEKQFDAPRFPYANHPRETVSWYQAVAFCRWLSAKLGETILLPHEYEWEVAARWAGGKTDNRTYPWGTEFDTENVNTSEGGVWQTTAVALYPAGKQPNLNLYDMGGNVWEWCRNKYSNPDDEKLDADSRVLRGGSWRSNQRFARAAYRSDFHLDGRGNSVGFRVVRRSFISAKT